MKEHTYAYQAVRLGDDGRVQRIGHERLFQASDAVSAIEAAEAVHDALHPVDHCNAIRIMDDRRTVLWTRKLAEHAGS